MKAEHRKELQTNVLADRMGRLVQGMRSTKGTSSLVAWVLAILAVGTFIAWYLASGSGAATSQAWVSVYDNVSPITLAQTESSNPGTLPARTAQFQQARILLQKGLENLCSANRASAVNDLEKVRGLYATLKPQCGDDTVLIQETLLGQARAEEALVGIPKNEEEGRDQYRGSLDRALEFYQAYLQSLRKDFPKLDDADADHSKYKEVKDVYEDVKKHADHLTKDHAKVEEFYKNLNQLAQEKK